MKGETDVDTALKDMSDAIETASSSG